MKTLSEFIEEAAKTSKDYRGEKYPGVKFTHSASFSSLAPALKQENAATHKTAAEWHKRMGDVNHKASGEWQSRNSSISRNYIEQRDKHRAREQHHKSAGKAK